MAIMTGIIGVACSQTSIRRCFRRLAAVVERRLLSPFGARLCVVLHGGQSRLYRPTQKLVSLVFDLEKTKAVPECVHHVVVVLL